MPAVDVIVIGGGVAGVSVAYHLARRGARVVVAERAAVGAGETASCVGGFRAQQPHDLEVRLSLESMAAFERFADEVGMELDLRRPGYLLLAVGPAGAARLRAEAAMQRRAGAPVELLEAGEVGARWPAVSHRDVALAAYCPLDGYADPYTVCAGYAAAARRLGAEIREGVEVRAVWTVGGRAEGVITSSGERLGAGAVILAAGVWSRGLAQGVGLDLPALPYPRHCFMAYKAGLPPFPVVLETEADLMIRPEAGGALFIKGRPERPSFEALTDWGFLMDAAPLAAARVPALRNAGFRPGMSGLRCLTPDKRAILGPAPGVEGLFLATGFSGHGFMHAPATGRLVAEMVLDGATSTPGVEELGAERFGLAAGEDRRPGRGSRGQARTGEGGRALDEGQGRQGHVR
ncbi:MAG: FAD-binding oxidoreductase [Acetobacteraceae bacterium]|nr:FAD-binding oxidoreductase [Acetobacteraceae bacterium]